MKYLILPLILVIAGCTETTQLTPSVRDASVDELRDKVTSLEAKLEFCQSDLQRATQYQAPPEPEQPKQLEYEEVDVWHVDGTKCYGADSDPIPACGRSFWDCKDGFNRNCMTNVKYKTSTEQKLVEE